MKRLTWQNKSGVHYTYHKLGAKVANLLTIKKVIPFGYLLKMGNTNTCIVKKVKTAKQIAHLIAYE